MKKEERQPEPCDSYASNHDSLDDGNFLEELEEASFQLAGGTSLIGPAHARRILEDLLTGLALGFSHLLSKSVNVF